MTPGGTAQQDFHVRVAKVRLRALASDGKTPLSGVQLWLATADNTRTAWPKPTGADGWTSLDALAIGTYGVRAWPSFLSSPEARQALGKKQQALDASVLVVASLAVDTEDVEVARVIVMPPGSGY